MKTKHVFYHSALPAGGKWCEYVISMHVDIYEKNKNKKKVDGNARGFIYCWCWCLASNSYQQQPVNEWTIIIICYGFTRKWWWRGAVVDAFRNFVREIYRLCQRQWVFDVQIIAIEYAFFIFLIASVYSYNIFFRLDAGYPPIDKFPAISSNHLIFLKSYFDLACSMESERDTSHFVYLFNSYYCLFISVQPTWANETFKIAYTNAHRPWAMEDRRSYFTLSKLSAIAQLHSYIKNKLKSNFKVIITVMLAATECNSNKRRKKWNEKPAK